MAFVYGKPVRGKNFVGREKEIREILHMIPSSCIAILGQRRIGKTSLLLKLEEKLRKKGNIVVFINVADITPLTEENFLKEYLEKSMQASENKKLVEKVVSFLNGKTKDIIQLIKTTHLKIADVLEVWFEYTEAKRKNLTNITRETLLYLEKIAQREKKNVVVLIDEFQLLNKLKNTDFEWAVRSNMQNTPNVHYIVSSSSLSSMKEMMQKDRAFFGFFVPLTLEGLQENEAKELLEQFRDYGLSVNEEFKQLAITKTRGFPLYLEALGIATITYSLEKKINELDVKDFDSCWNRMLDLLSYHFEEMEGKLRSHEKTGNRMYVFETMVKYNLHSPSEVASIMNVETIKVQQYFRRLFDDGYIKKSENGVYLPVDPVFCEWIMKRKL